MLGIRATWQEERGGFYSLYPAQSPAQRDSPENTSLAAGAGVSGSKPPGCCGVLQQLEGWEALWEGIRLDMGVFK